MGIRTEFALAGRSLDMAMRLELCALLSVCILATASVTVAEEGGGPQVPPVRKIAGITAEDPFPGGCVDCHVNRPDIKKDVRISTAMSSWYEGVDTRLLEKVQPLVEGKGQLKGVHPTVQDSLRDIPAGCMKCHRENSAAAIPFSGMMHLIHLVGGENNHFMTIFQGECTYCHKFSPAKGEWSLPSGPEK